MAKRKGISKKTRFEVFKRDNFTCQYCGSHPPQVILHVDHINPVSKGGENDSDNLITSCLNCNIGKGAKLLTSVPQSLQDKAKEIAEREEQLKGYSEIIQSKKDRIEDEAWRVGEELDALYEDGSINRSYLVSIKRFLEKLGLHDVLDAAEIARAAKPYSRNTRFKYFCGVCWNKINREKEDG